MSEQTPADPTDLSELADLTELAHQMLDLARLGHVERLLAYVDAGVPVVPVAIAYHDPRDAWIGDDGFVGHFMSRFSRPRVRVSISFGPPLQDDDVEALRLAAQTWVRDELTRLHRALDTPYDLINPQDRVGALPG